MMKMQVIWKIDVIYGGGCIWLVGLISKGVYDGSCHVLGVIPRALLPIEVSIPLIHIAKLFTTLPLNMKGLML
ncbi:hypothetical protein Nepgr_000963 [Nepenthes gracilis]|uniref:Uncharacterized protein n=1 Tax=Nepenthes gracilis TaxID=150966 RepID=A0AAD3P7D3_NEPGR|nr:hypothetical protein Nepgr_000963 [Nepenthes gracilis]